MQLIQGALKFFLDMRYGHMGEGKERPLPDGWLCIVDQHWLVKSSPMVFKGVLMCFYLMRSIFWLHNPYTVRWISGESLADGLFFSFSPSPLHCLLLNICRWILYQMTIDRNLHQVAEFRRNVLLLIGEIWSTYDIFYLQMVIFYSHWTFEIIT